MDLAAIAIQVREVESAALTKNRPLYEANDAARWRA